jgi:hypothetical protein
MVGMVVWLTGSLPVGRYCACHISQQPYMTSATTGHVTYSGLLLYTGFAVLPAC